MIRTTFAILALLSCSSAAFAVQVDDTDPSISYNGIWGSGPNNSPDFDQYEHYSNDTGTPATATFSFTGTTATAVMKRGPNFGIAHFFVDSSLAATVDAYNSTQMYQQNLYMVQGLPNACHTLTIQVGSTHNLLSTDFYQVADAFITDGIVGCSVAGETDINDTDSSIVYSLGGPTNWNYGGGPEDFHNDEHYSNLVRLGGTIQGAGVSVTFNGTGITWSGKKGPNFGMATYSVDGGAPVTFDGHSPTELDQNANVTIAGLSPGSHVLQISLLGTHNPNSSQYYQVIDAFEITGSALAHSSGTTVGYPQISTNSSGVSKSGSWTCGGNNPSDLSGGHCWSNVANSSITWTFNGSLVEVFGRPDLEDGYMTVYVDNNYVATIDGHFGTVDDDAVNSYMLFAGKLSSGGLHTITLVATGTHSPGATDNYIQIDELTAFQ
jgi:hypothetical protein